ncbi:MAG: phage tail protein [Actinomycetota bacterium]
MSDPGIGYRFMVDVDGKQLGAFTKIDGLGAKYDVTTVKEGGENTFVHLLPGRVTYENLKLTRPVDASSGALAAWFTEFQTELQRAGRLKPTSAAITAYGPNDKAAATWTLSDVVPVSYSGPSFEAGSTAVLVESLELAHHGFWSG